MSPPALLVFDDDVTQKATDDEWQGFRVFPGENPNPNFDLFVKKAILQSEKTVGPIFSHSLSSTSAARDDSFKMMLPPAMPPPRDSAVPLPLIPEPVRIRKKISRQESILSLRKNRYSDKTLYEEKPQRRFDSAEEGFRCNAFCLALPGFGKPKSSPKREDPMEKKMIKTPSFSNSTISTRASLEKFECGSWASTTVLITAHENRRFFDLPVEMIKGGGDVQTPVSSGFLFDRETEVLKGVLKTSSSGRLQRKSPETSPRRVRFSTSVSCPTSPRSCITPRLRQARDDFNAFLAAEKA